MKEKPKGKIEIRGGVAYFTKANCDMEIQIVDWDNYNQRNEEDLIMTEEDWINNTEFEGPEEIGDFSEKI